MVVILKRLQGGYQYKEAIVNTIIAVIEANPSSQDTGLYHLCEFIEDCEHGVLATKILHLLGREGPKTPTPAKFIRYIYNRVILENSTVSQNLGIFRFRFIICPVMISCKFFR